MSSETLTAEQWLAKWDAGEIVPTIEMGGLGPGYEQAIQITVAEILRGLIEHQAPRDDGDGLTDWWAEHRDDFTEVILNRPVVGQLGVSGAQWGGAVNLAVNIYRRGTEAFQDSELADRRILVSRDFPRGEAPDGE